MSKLINFILIALFASSISMLSPAVYADNGNNPNKQVNASNAKSLGHGKIKQKKAKDRSQENQNAKILVQFSDKDKIKIADYFKIHPLAGTSLPPGIAKNLARGKPLPPGIAKKFLPSSALAALPSYPGYEYLIAGKNVLLVNATTKIIADILSNVLQ